MAPIIKINEETKEKLRKLEKLLNIEYESIELIKINEKTLEALTTLNLEHELIEDEKITKSKYFNKKFLFFRGDSFREGNFYKDLKKMNNTDYKPATLEEIANLRNQADFNEEIWKRGTMTSAGIIYSPNQEENPIMVKESPLLDLDRAKKAVELHRNGKYEITTKQEYENYKKIAEQEKSKSLEERTALILPFDETTKISTDSDVFKFAFGKEAEQYADRLKQKNRSQIEVSLQDKEDTPGKYSINQIYELTYKNRRDAAYSKLLNNPRQLLNRDVNLGIYAYK